MQADRHGAAEVYRRPPSSACLDTPVLIRGNNPSSCAAFSMWLDQPDADLLPRIGTAATNIPNVYPRFFAAPWAAFTQSAGTGNVAVLWDYAYCRKMVTR